MKQISYGRMGNQCVNSNWTAKWLTDGECCQCNFECKIKVFEIKSGYEYIITQKEYEKLLKNKQISNL